MGKNEYYVYLYLREDGTPYYVGKGKNNRAYQWHGNVDLPETDDRIIFADTNLYEDDALEKESELILHYGRKDIRTGILHNRNDGGSRGQNAGQTRWVNNGVIDIRIGEFDIIPEGYSAGRLYKPTPKRRINNGVRMKNIDLDVPCPSGWVEGHLGSSYNAGYICINDGVDEKFIPKNDVVPDGWTKGRCYRNSPDKLKKISEGNKNWMWITDGINPAIRVRKDSLIPPGYKQGNHDPKFGPKTLESYMKAIETRRRNGTLAPTKTSLDKMVKTRMQNGNYAVSEETRKKISESLNRPEVKAKHSESMKATWARKRAEKLQESADLTEFFISDPVSD
jgi:hypothetical protein